MSFDISLSDTRPNDGGGAEPPETSAAPDASLLDLADHLLDLGLVVEGELVLGLADVDLIYIRLSALIAPVDRVLGPLAARREAQEPERSSFEAEPSRREVSARTKGDVGAP
ncbi:MAG TPA: gas vesicle protein GvpJ [Planctomycetota bacterium]|nr:gas vesicle protein GvpJ [Planctomycetota bacterium]